MSGMSEMAPDGTVPEWTLGWRMQRALAHAGLSVEAMADELEVSRSTISRWINDRGAAPRNAYIKMWALRCGVSYEWLAGDRDPRVRGGRRHVRETNPRLFLVAA
jgi:transcriptional regulator with XRE-family HTH domain